MRKNPQAPPMPAQKIREGAAPTACKRNIFMFPYGIRASKLGTVLATATWAYS
jgi:hypothetical protein